MAKILVVDNNMLFLRYAKTFLEKQFEVYTSSTIESAGIFMMNFDFDLIVIDEGMGSGKAGFDFTIRQKQKQRFCKTPVIMLYVTADENDYRFPADPKIDRYIAKKYSREYLLGNILEVLK